MMKKKKAILIIEDELDIAELMKDYLEHNEFKVLIAKSRNEAFFKINNQKFDCIISDINLNQADVVPVLKELSSNPKGMNFGVPVVIHSAFVTGPVIKKHRDIIKAVHVKPTSSEDLVNSIKALLKKPKPESNPANA